jgi:hypothetical protein
MIRLAIFELFALLLFFSCFCRSVHTSKANTKRDIRWAFTFLGVVAILCIVLPLWGWRPDTVTVLLIAAAAITQLVTSYHWRAGVPPRFQKGEP